MRRVAVAVLVVILLGITAWWTAALVIAGPQPTWLREALAASYAIGMLAVLSLVRPWRRALLVWCIACAVLLAWWSSFRPSNERDWQPDVARLPSVEIDGELLKFHNIRNFDYRS